MTRNEMSRLLAVIAAAFPRFQVDDSGITLNVWHEMLGDLDYQVAQLAVKKLIMQSTFPPSIAEVRKAATDMLNPGLTTGAQAWGEVTRAIRDYGYYREAEAIASMSPTTARVVKYMGWRDICMSEEPTGVLRGHFMRMYDQVADREAQERLLPAGLQEQISRLAAGKDLTLIEGGEK